MFRNFFVEEKSLKKEFVLKLSAEHNPIGTLLDVVGWVFAWDGLEVLTAERWQLKRQLKLKK